MHLARAHCAYDHKKRKRIKREKKKNWTSILFASFRMHSLAILQFYPLFCACSETSWVIFVYFFFQEFLLFLHTVIFFSVRHTHRISPTCNSFSMDHAAPKKKFTLATANNRHFWRPSMSNLTCNISYFFSFIRFNQEIELHRIVFHLNHLIFFDRRDVNASCCLYVSNIFNRNYF